MLWAETSRLLTYDFGAFPNGQMDSNSEKQEKNSEDWNANSILEAVTYDFMLSIATH